jgi:phosphatidylserine decarboxylase
VAKDGLVLVIAAIFLTLVLWFLFCLHGQIAFLILAIIFSLLAIFLALFFRDPKRIIPNEENIVLSPADGHIDEIERLSSVSFLEGAAIRVSIFMSIFDVHINRLPISGEVKYIERKSGKSLPAFKKESAKENQQIEIRIDDFGFRIILRQMVGFTARRLVCRLKVGDKVKMGYKFGMIKFGSRVELLLPQSVELRVKLGDKVKAGETIIGTLKR